MWGRGFCIGLEVSLAKCYEVPASEREGKVEGRCILYTFHIHALQVNQIHELWLWIWPATGTWLGNNSTWTCSVSLSFRCLQSYIKVLSSTEFCIWLYNTTYASIEWKEDYSSLLSFYRLYKLLCCACSRIVKRCFYYYYHILLVFRP